jgi:hypothetical protein
VSSSEVINAQMAELNYTLIMAQKFIDSKAFPSMQPEQAYVLIKAGGEMGLQPMESMTSLCIISGSVSFHSKALAGRLTKLGYKIEFKDETEKGVTCIISHENGFNKTESISKDSPQLGRSKAMEFAPKNKMRFHCIRQIANFHLAHLFGSVSIWEEDDIPSNKAESPYTKEQITELLELKAEMLSPDDLIHIERILGNNEVDKFKSIFNKLKAL